MKKYLIKDEDNAIYEITELEKDAEVETPEETKKDDALELTQEEIIVLKKLIPHVNEILALLNVEKTDDVVDEDKTQEQIVDTEEEKEQLKDSVKSSAVSNKVKDSYIEDSINDDISSVWSKRYNMYRKGEN